MTKPLGYYGLNLPTGELESELRALNYQQTTVLFSEIAFRLSALTYFPANESLINFESQFLYNDGDQIITKFSQAQLIALSKWLTERLDELLRKQPA